MLWKDSWSHTSMPHHSLQEMAFFFYILSAWDGKLWNEMLNIMEVKFYCKIFFNLHKKDENKCATCQVNGEKKGHRAQHLLAHLSTEMKARWPWKRGQRDTEWSKTQFCNRWKQFSYIFSTHKHIRAHLTQGEATGAEERVCSGIELPWIIKRLVWAFW